MRKGFTLIELLAVIVILAIIALIAIPIVINIINDAKEESLKRSVQNYLDTVEKTITKENLKTKYNPDKCEIQETGKLKCFKDFEEYPEELEIDIQGEKATSGTIKFKKGKIIKIKYLTLGDNYYRYDDGKVYKTEVPPKEAGLYDENYNLLASWDELINSYGLEIKWNSVISQGLNNIINNNVKLQSGTIFIIKDGISTIEENAFRYCSSLKEIILPNSITSIKQYAFANCTSLEETILPDSITWLGDYAFASCVNLKNVNIPKNITEIRQLVFYNCKNLTNVIIPENVIYIGQYAFSECDNLEKVIIPNTVTGIGKLAFSNCKKLKSITIPGSVTTIGESAFQVCTSLENIEIMNEVKNIDSQAFLGCTNLKKITIPSSVININSHAFSYCNNLKSVIFENTNGWYLTDYYNTEHIDIDVTNKELNATNLVTTYKNKYWKRS